MFNCMIKFSVVIAINGRIIHMNKLKNYHYSYNSERKENDRWEGIIANATDERGVTNVEDNEAGAGGAIRDKMEQRDAHQTDLNTYSNTPCGITSFCEVVLIFSRFLLYLLSSTSLASMII